jgi:tetratricopeptide (TPR) repeat protein
MPVKSAQRHTAVNVGLLALVVAGSPAILPAQRTLPQPPAQRGQRGPDTKTILLATFRSEDRQLGVQAGDEFRHRLQTENNARDLFVVTKDDINRTLEASGYKPDSALSVNDLMELGKERRADEVVDGRVSKNPDGTLHAETRLLLRRNNTILAQPLPAIDAKNAGDAAKMFERALSEARKALPAYTTCENDLRAQKFDAAIVDGRAALAAYPRSTLGRLCLLTAFKGSSAPSDSIIRVADEVLSIDSVSVIALGMAAEAYASKGDKDKNIEYMFRLYRANPRDQALVSNIVEKLALLGAPDKALPIVDELVKENPGDASILRTKWLLQLAAQQYKGALVTGEEYAKADTSAANVDFFQRMGTAAQLDSQPQRAGAILARGVQKFPADADLQLLYAQALAKQGQLQQALGPAKRAIESNPSIRGGQIYVLSLLSQLNMTDSLVVASQRAIAAGANKDTVGQVLVTIAGPAVNKAQESKTRADWQEALRSTSLVDSLVPSPTTKFLSGFSAYNVGVDAAGAIQEVQKVIQKPKGNTAANRAKACDEAKLAEDMFATAMINVPMGASFNADGATKVMSATQQYIDFVQSAKKAYCK